MQSRPYPLVPLTIAGSFLGLLLSLEGVYARLYGAFWLRGGADPWWLVVGRSLSGQAQPDLHLAGWLPVVVGTAWFGALAGLWLNHRWGRHALLAVAVLSGLHGGVFTVLAAVCLALALTASIRQWAQPSA